MIQNFFQKNLVKNGNINLDEIFKICRKFEKKYPFPTFCSFEYNNIDDRFILFIFHKLKTFTFNYKKKFITYNLKF